MQEMAMLRCLRMNPLGSWNRNLGFTPPQQTFSCRKTCERFFATGKSFSLSLQLSLSLKGCIAI